jgi:hypothetical protein
MNDSTTRNWTRPTNVPVLFGGTNSRGELLPWTKTTAEEAAAIVGMERVVLVEVRHKAAFTFTTKIAAA